MSSRLSRRGFLQFLSTLSLMTLFDERLRARAAIDRLSHNPGAPNVLILVFDTLSANHMSLYGYHRDTTPHLARFAERATVYHSHYSAGNFTTTGTSSILTGTYPWTHRAFHLYGRAAKGYQNKNLFHMFSPETYKRISYTHNDLVTVILDHFGEDIDLFKLTRELCLVDSQFSDQVFPKDYYLAYLGERRSLRSIRSAVYSSSLFLSLIDRIRNFALRRTRSLQEYTSLFPKGVPSHDFQYFVNEHATDWMTTLFGGSLQPFLAYVHLWPPHSPYNTRREFIGRFEDGSQPLTKKENFFTQGFSDRELNRLRREYDEYIAYTDAEFGRLFDFMDETGALENTYVIFTSDHGELFERGIWGHVTPALYEPVIRVPLLISKPGQREHEAVHTPTSSVDLLPTLLQATGAEIPAWCEGEVLPTFSGREPDPERSIFSVEAKRNPKHAPLTIGTVALIKGHYKLIHYFGYEGYENAFELYDLANDPEELNDLYASEQPVAAALQAELLEKLSSVNQPYA